LLFAYVAPPQEEVQSTAEFLSLSSYLTIRAEKSEFDMRSFVIPRATGESGKGVPDPGCARNGGDLTLMPAQR
jgi:hypothetical protein